MQAELNLEISDNDQYLLLCDMIRYNYSADDFEQIYTYRHMILEINRQITIFNIAFHLKRNDILAFFLQKMTLNDESLTYIVHNCVDKESALLLDFLKTKYPPNERMGRAIMDVIFQSSIKAHKSNEFISQIIGRPFNYPPTNNSEAKDILLLAIKHHSPELALEILKGYTDILHLHLAPRIGIYSLQYFTEDQEQKDELRRFAASGFLKNFLVGCGLLGAYFYCGGPLRKHIAGLYLLSGAGFYAGHCMDSYSLILCSSALLLATAISAAITLTSAAIIEINATLSTVLTNAYNTYIS